MPNADKTWDRLAAIVRIVKEAQSYRFGRTSLMKVLYFLKTLKGVPVGFDFKLYTYGPFDRRVLEDLDYAEALGAVCSEAVTYSGGYRYELKPGPKAEEIERMADRFLAEHGDDIRELVERFGGYSALDLEMLSTLIFVDRAAADNKEDLSDLEAVRRVRDVKPYLSKENIRNSVDTLKQNGYLLSVH